MSYQSFEARPSKCALFDCSANPNYPPGLAGDTYLVSVAGIIGGASGTSVAAGQTFSCIATNAGGTQAAVGSSWETSNALAAGAELTNPILLVNSGTATGAGTNLATATAVATSSIAVLSVTGATDTGFALPVAAAGKVMIFRKATTDVLNIYATTGGTLNGGTSAVALGAVVTIVFSVAANAWLACVVAS